MRSGRCKSSSASFCCPFTNFCAAGVPVILPSRSQSIGRWWGEISAVTLEHSTGPRFFRSNVQGPSVTGRGGCVRSGADSCRSSRSRPHRSALPGGRPRTPRRILPQSCRPPMSCRTSPIAFRCGHIRPGSPRESCRNALLKLVEGEAGHKGRCGVPPGAKLILRFVLRLMLGLIGGVAGARFAVQIAAGGRTVNGADYWWNSELGRHARGRHLPAGRQPTTPMSKGTLVPR